MSKPSVKPAYSNFSSGPCAKHPGYSLDELKDTPFGRSHRGALGKSKLELSIKNTRRLLGVPADYRIGIVPASDTGAFEMAMWSLLGPRAIDVFHWESFGEGWAVDITKQLKLPINEYKAEYGRLPDLTKANPENDIVFAWNGTTAGVKVPNADWIAGDRKGLALCDATSAVFAMEIPWQKLDVVTFSWQKVLGGEAAHGMLILSPRAIERLQSYKPSWPMPKIFRMTNSKGVMEDLFEGNVINTPSMLANEDYLAALAWAEKIGGVKELIRRSEESLSIFEKFVAERDWIDFLADKKEYRSNTSVCFVLKLEADRVKKIVKLLEAEGVAYDCAAYKEAPAGLRFWCGGTIEPSDIEKLLPWIDWAYEEARK